MAITFDGSSGLYRSSALDRVADSDKGTVLLWTKRNTVPTVTDTYMKGTDASGNSVFLLLSNALNEVILRTFKVAGGGTGIEIKTDGTWTTTSEYRCFSFSYDITNELSHAYMGNTDVKASGTVTNKVTVPLTTATQWDIGGDDLATTPVTTVEADVAFIAFWPGLYIDLSDEDERRNLISNDGEPVGFGVDGSGRGGREGIDQTPIILFSGPFVKNIGTGGAFQTLGTLSSTRSPDAYRPSADRPTYGIRWYDSDRSGFSYPRNEMVRDKYGRRVGVDEEDEPDRDDFKEVDFGDLIAGEEDYEDVL